MRVADRDGRPILVRVIVWGGSFALAFSIFVGYFIYQAVMNPFPRSNVRIEGDRDIEIDPQIGFIQSRNASTLRSLANTDFRYQIFTDRRSARVNEKGQQTPDRVDMLTVGGSFAHGHGMANEHSFTERLGRATGLRVANFSLGSYGTTQSWQMLERNLDLRPKLVIYAFIEHHLWRNINPCAPSYSYCLAVAYVAFEDDDEARPYLHPPHFDIVPPDMDRRFMEEVVVADERSLLTEVIWKMRTAVYDVRGATVFWPKDTESRRREAFRFLLERMVDATESIDATLLVVYIPNVTPGDVYPPPEILVDLVASHDIVFVDLYPVFSKHYSDPSNPVLYLRKDDDHPNELAHALIAETLLKVIHEDSRVRQKLGL
ncbi:MAG TPA: SGNH/GDSL hydrolase family protein [Vicinamibacteria bacterium]|nr:SGNH/GDSL hydrolase family protein [Vicinamibacteria bacterium]